MNRWLVGRLLSLAVLGVAVGLAASSAGVTGAYLTATADGSIGGSIAGQELISATVRVVPRTISLAGKGDVQAFVEGLAPPHQLTEIDLDSIELCLRATCMSSDGTAKLAGKAHVAARFDRGGFAALVGGLRGDVALVVQGILADGTEFIGQSINRVIDREDDDVRALPACDPGPSADPAVAPAGPDTQEQPAPTCDPAMPTPEAAASPGPTEPPEATAPPEASPVPEPTPVDPASPSPTPNPTPTPVESPPPPDEPGTAAEPPSPTPTP